MAKVRLKAVSKSTHRASAEEKERFGSDTVTEFFVTRLDRDETRVFTGCGTTEGDRKTNALQKAAEFWKLKGGPRASLGANYYLWAVEADSGDPLGEERQGPFDFRTAKDTGRLNARTGDHDWVVTEGEDPSNVVRLYQAGTGAILVRK